METKKIINGRKYDTKTAEWIATWSSGGGWRDLDHFQESLYRKKTGEYFIWGIGCARTRYAECLGVGWYSTGEDVLPLTEDEARAWGEKHMDADAYEAEFGPVEE